MIETNLWDTSYYRRCPCLRSLPWPPPSVSLSRSLSVPENFRPEQEKRGNRGMSAERRRTHLISPGGAYEGPETVDSVWMLQIDK